MSVSCRNDGLERGTAQTFVLLFDANVKNSHTDSGVAATRKMASVSAAAYTAWPTQRNDRVVAGQRK
jgi:hypothetical protein